MLASWLVSSSPVERSGFEPRPGTLCCVLRVAFYSYIASLRPGVIMGTGALNVGGNPAMD